MSLDTASTPPFLALSELAARLKAAGIPFALGGSAVLAHYGLETQVRDWDVTTEGSWNQIAPLLKDWDHEVQKPSGIYATNFLCKISLHGASIDLMSGFAVRTADGGIYNVATVAADVWRGIPVGSPEIWQKAYALMGRDDQAARLAEYLKTRTTP